RGFGEGAVIDLNPGQPFEQRQQVRTRRAAAAFFDRDTFPQPGGRARVGGVGALRRDGTQQADGKSPPSQGQMQYSPPLLRSTLRIIAYVGVRARAQKYPRRPIEGLTANVLHRRVARRRRQREEPRMARVRDIASTELAPDLARIYEDFASAYGPFRNQ